MKKIKTDIYKSIKQRMLNTIIKGINLYKLDKAVYQFTEDLCNQQRKAIIQSLHMALSRAKLSGCLPPNVFYWEYDGPYRKPQGLRIHVPCIITNEKIGSVRLTHKIGYILFIAKYRV